MVQKTLPVCNWALDEIAQILFYLVFYPYHLNFDNAEIEFEYFQIDNHSPIFQNLRESHYYPKLVIVSSGHNIKVIQFYQAKTLWFIRANAFKSIIFDFCKLGLRLRLFFCFEYSLWVHLFSEWVVFCKRYSYCGQSFLFVFFFDLHRIRHPASNVTGSLFYNGLEYTG